MIVAVLVTLGLAQPRGTARVAVLGVAVVTGLVVVALGAARVRPLWQSWGGLLAALLLGLLFVATGGIDSVYQDAVVAVMVVSALTLPLRLVVVNSLAVLAAAASPWLYDQDAGGVLVTDLLADAGIWIAITAGVFLQARTLEDQARRLLDSDQLRVAFLRATSHELRTPLTSVAGFAATLERHGDALDRDQQRELVVRINANAERLTRLIEDLLDVDRLTSGVASAQRTPADLPELVLRVLETVDTEGRVLDCDLAPVTVPVDVPKFERVVLNLVANAVRHSPPGGTVEVAVRDEGGHVVLAVRDHGDGIVAGFEQRIFEPFVQGPERRDAASPGTGLGLTLVRQLVDLHGGDVRASNAPGGGALFEVELPVVP